MDTCPTGYEPARPAPGSMGKRVKSKSVALRASDVLTRPVVSRQVEKAVRWRVRQDIPKRDSHEGQKNKTKELLLAESVACSEPLGTAGWVPYRMSVLDRVPRTDWYVAVSVVVVVVVNLESPLTIVCAFYRGARSELISDGTAMFVYVK